MDAISSSLKKFVQAVDPYVELSQKIVTNIFPSLQIIAESSSNLGIIDRIGEAEYVAWRNFPDSLFEAAKNEKSSEGLLKLIMAMHSDDNFAEIEKTVEQLKQNEYLKDNPVFLQSINAYKRSDYDIAVLGCTVMIDKLLSAYTGMISTTNIKRRIEVIKEKVEKSEKIILDDSEINDYILIATFFNAFEKFGADSRFNEEEPQLNRHWIAHGRMERKLEQIDCIRLINLMRGIILIVKI